MVLKKCAISIGGALSGFLVATGALSADYVSPLVGGGGGTAYSRDCGANAAFVGLQVRSGSWVDQATPVCQSIATNGALGQIFTQARIGGTGGTNAVEARCASGKVVTGAKVRWASYIERINLLCATWDPATKSPRNDGVLTGYLGNGYSTAPTSDFTCPAGQVAKGLKGKAGIYLDSMALVCNLWSQ